MFGISAIATWFASGAAKAMLGIFGDTIVQPFLNAYLKSKDVDLSKFQSSQTNTLQLATAILSANIEYAKVKGGIIATVLQWWAFRVILFLLIATATTRFMLASFDSTWWWIFGCTAHDIKGVVDGTRIYGDACSWSIPPIRGVYGDAERQFLLFFIIAKPVDTVVTGALSLISKYLTRK